MKYALACGNIFTLPSPQGLSYQELQLLWGNCQNLLCSLIKLSGWLGGFGFVCFCCCLVFGFFFFYSPRSPFWNLLEPIFYTKLFSINTFRVFEILSRSLAMGQGKGIFELDLCGNIFFKNLFQLHRSCAGDSLFIIVASHIQNWIWLLLCYQLVTKPDFSEVNCHSFLMPPSGSPHPVILMRDHQTPWATAFPLDMYRVQFPSYIYISIMCNL